MPPTFALDCRLELGKPSSYTRVLELLREGAVAAGLDFVEWTAGPCCAPILWCPSPDMPEVEDDVRLLPTLHDITPLLPSDRFFLRRWRTAARFRGVVHGMAARATRVVTVSEFARRSIAEAFPILASKLSVVPNFPAPGFTPSGEAEDAPGLAAQGLPTEAVLFVAALRRHKNWEVLLRAWAALPSDVRRAHPLILAGDARRARGRPERIARALGVTEDLHLPGRIAEEHLAALYRSACVFVFPSLAEGFGLPPLEAMACGTPVIASTSTSLPEVLGEACLSFEPKDTQALTQHLLSALGSDAMRRDLAARGLVQARIWSAERTGAAMAATIEDALA